MLLAKVSISEDFRSPCLLRLRVFVVMAALLGSLADEMLGSYCSHFLPSRDIMTEGFFLAIRSRVEKCAVMSLVLGGCRNMDSR